MKEIKKVLGSRVLLKQDYKKKVGSIILAPESQEKTQEAHVLKVGEDVTSIEVGDLVLFDKFSGTILNDDTASDDEYVLTLLDEEDIFAIVEE